MGCNQRTGAQSTHFQKIILNRKSKNVQVTIHKLIPGSPIGSKKLQLLSNTSYFFRLFLQFAKFVFIYNLIFQHVFNPSQLDIINFISHQLANEILLRMEVFLMSVCYYWFSLYAYSLWTLFLTNPYWVLGFFLHISYTLEIVKD